MDLTEPLRFEPLFMERVWGGRRLETLFGKRLPPSTRIGESWELVDREDAQSVVHEGPLRGFRWRTRSRCRQRAVNSKPPLAVSSGIASGCRPLLPLKSEVPFTGIGGSGDQQSKT